MNTALTVYVRLAPYDAQLALGALHDVLDDLVSGFPASVTPEQYGALERLQSAITAGIDR